MPIFERLKRPSFSVEASSININYLYMAQSFLTQSHYKNKSFLTNNSITVNNSLHQYFSGCENLQIRIENKLLNTSHWQADELQGKVGQCFLSDSKVGPQVVSEKIILAVLRYFPRKPCLTGSISRNALVVQRTAKVRVLTI